ncbi:MAG: transporter substrate-binding domain-containing protein [Bifidobacteriaceae bacterium]|jgi:putative lysine transport system substrate-binding protein|nr:transporter substrate-binding domain-containing protein [Bifidobacteriaceae bacterium]
MRVKVRQMFAFVAVFSLGLIGVSACSSNGTDAAGVLKVGMECAYAPFNWSQVDDANNAAEVDGGGYANGYDVRIAQRVADKLGKKLVVVKTEWDGLLPALTSGKIDLIIAGMSPTEERKESIDFSEFYYSSKVVMVVKADGKYPTATSIQDFAGAKVTSQLGITEYDMIDQIKGVDKQPALEDFPTMITALKAGKIDGYVAEYPAAKSAIMANPDLAIVEFPEDKGFEFALEKASTSIGVKKGETELLNAVNETLTGIFEAEREQLMSEALAEQPVSE